MDMFESTMETSSKLDMNGTLTTPVSVIASYRGHYYGYPNDLIIPSRYIYIEFDANSANEWNGFEMSMNIRNTSGEKKQDYLKHIQFLYIILVLIIFIHV